MSYAVHSLEKIAEDVGRALVRLTSDDGHTVRITTPLLYPGGTMVTIEISNVRDRLLVTDAGRARREAGLIGAERTFGRVAGEVAARYGVHFDHNMIFVLDVPSPEVVAAVISVANAAKSAVELTAVRAATTEYFDYRAHLWAKLERLYEPAAVFHNRAIRGSSDEWRFDAAVQRERQLSLFEIVLPHRNAVSSAVTKFLDIRDLGPAAPARFAVLTDVRETPHLPVLARTARIINIDDPDDTFREAA